MPLRRLAQLEREKIVEEHAELMKTIAYLEDLLANPQKILHLIKNDVIDLRDKYANKRRTQIWEEEATEFAAGKTSSLTENDCSCARTDS